MSSITVGDIVLVKFMGRTEAVKVDLYYTTLLALSLTSPFCREYKR